MSKYGAVKEVLVGYYFPGGSYYPNLANLRKDAFQNLSEAYLKLLAGIQGLAEAEFTPVFNHERQNLKKLLAWYKSLEDDIVKLCTAPDIATSNAYWNDLHATKVESLSENSLLDFGKILEGNVVGEQQKNAGLITQLSEAQKAIENARQELASKNQQNANLTQRSKELEQRIDQAQKDVAELKGQVQIAKLAAVEARQAREELEKQLNNEHNKKEVVVKVGDENQKLVIELEKMREQLQQVQKTNEEFASELDKVQKDNAELVAKLGMARQEVENVNQENVSLKGYSANLEDAQGKSDLENAQERYMSQSLINKMNDKIKYLKDKNGKLVKSLKSLTNDFAENSGEGSDDLSGEESDIGGDVEEMGVAGNVVPSDHV